MVLKNEDQWVWFAIQSVLPHATQLLITDTGSSDNTVRVIKCISSSKIKFTQISVNTPLDVTAVRQRQIKETKTDWIWIVDGDEVYPSSTAKEVVKATTGRYEGIAVRRYDLMGDVYHRQRESIGEYNLFGQRGHLVSRLFNLKQIKGLHVAGDYPLEGYHDSENVLTQNRDKANWYITNNYLYHAMYLQRSSMGSNLKGVFNRSKYKIEQGIQITEELPEVFSLKRPSIVPDPTLTRSMSYEVAASVITPIKNLKRTLL